VPDASLPCPFGRYELLALVGRGGMGEVYRARLIGPAGPGKEIALKVLRPDAQSKDAKALDRFLREGRLGALIRHPNVVRVLDVGEVDGQAYVAMEYVDGRSLSQLIASHGALPARPLLDFALQSALGLAALHDLGVTQAGDVTLVHRDIKPGNLIADVTGRVKIADFGIATLAGRDEVTSVMGTLGYMSPEQLFGRDLDARSDLFSLGVTLFVAATDSRLFSNSAIGLVVDELRNIDNRVRGSDLLAPVDAALPGLGAVLANCLRFDPDDRYADAHELWADLDQLGAQVGDLPTLASIVRDGGGAPTFEPLVPMAASTAAVPSSSIVRDNAVVGRDKELVELATLAARSPMVVVTGPPGIGKSALVREGFPKAVWVDVSACGGITGVSGALAATFGFQGEVDLELLLPLTSAEVIVLDGLARTSREVAEALERWTAATPDTSWVVTCREAPRIRAAELALTTLDASSSAALLEALAPAVDKRELARLVQRLEGLPIALELAGRALAQHEGGSLTQVDPGVADGLRAALDWSWRRMARVERQALVQAAVFEGSFALADLEQVVELPESSRPLGEVIDALVQRGVVKVRDERLVLTPVLRDYGRSRQDACLDVGGQRHLRVRHAARMAELGTAEGLHAIRGPGAQEALEALVAARPDLEAALEFSLQVAAGTTAARCTCALYALAEAGRGGAPADSVYRRVVSQRHLTAREGTRLMLWRAGYERLVDEEEAVRLATAAQERARADGDAVREGEAHSLMADALVSLNRHADAAPHLVAAQKLARQAGDRRLEAITWRTSARRLSRLGRNDRALEHIGRASSLASSIGDPSLSGRVLGLEGLLLARRGDCRAAWPLLVEAAQELEAIGRAHAAGLAWSNVAFACRSLDRAAAADARKRARQLLLQGGAVAQAYSVKLSDAVDACDGGRIEEALQILREVVAMARSRGDDDLLRAALCDQVCVEVVGRRFDDARRHYPEAATLVGRSRDRRRHVTLAYTRARMALEEGDDAEVLRLEEQIAAVVDRIDATYLDALLAQLRGLIAMRRGDLEHACTLFEAAVAGFVDGDITMALEAQAQRATCLGKLGRVPDARRVLGSARQLAADRQVPDGLGVRWLDEAELELRPLSR